MSVSESAIYISRRRDSDQEAQPLAIAATLARVAANDPKLRKVTWARDRNVTDEVVVRLAAALESAGGNTNVRHIDLDGTCVTTAGMARLNQALGQTMVHFVDLGYDNTPALTEAEIEAHAKCLENIIEAVGRNDPDVRWLNLSMHFGVDDTLIERVATALEGNEYVEVISLRDQPDVTEAGAAFLEAVIPRCILQRVHVDESGMENRESAFEKLCWRNAWPADLRSAKENDPRLTRINWADFHFSIDLEDRLPDNEMVGLLAEALCNNTHVTDLRINGSDRVDAVGWGLLESVIPSSVVEKIEIQSDSEITGFTQSESRYSGYTQSKTATISKLCERNLAVNYAVRIHRPAQRLLLAALREPTLTNIATSLPSDVLEMVAERLASTRTCPATKEGSWEPWGKNAGNPQNEVITAQFQWIPRGYPELYPALQLRRCYGTFEWFKDGEDIDVSSTCALIEQNLDFSSRCGSLPSLAPVAWHDYQSTLPTTLSGRSSHTNVKPEGSRRPVDA